MTPPQFRGCSACSWLSGGHFLHKPCKHRRVPIMKYNLRAGGRISLIIFGQVTFHGDCFYFPDNVNISKNDADHRRGNVCGDLFQKNLGLFSCNAARGSGDREAFPAAAQSRYVYVFSDRKNHPGIPLCLQNNHPDFRHAETKNYIASTKLKRIIAECRESGWWILVSVTCQGDHCFIFQKNRDRMLEMHGDNFRVMFRVINFRRVMGRER